MFDGRADVRRRLEPLVGGRGVAGRQHRRAAIAPFARRVVNLIYSGLMSYV